jgi:hypothetical protein
LIGEIILIFLFKNLLISHYLNNNLHEIVKPVQVILPFYWSLFFVTGARIAACSAGRYFVGGMFPTTGSIRFNNSAFS